MDSYKNLLDAIELQADYALETGNLENLINPAPPEYWRMLVKAESEAEMFAGMKLPELLSNVDCGVLQGEQRYGIGYQVPKASFLGREVWNL